MANHLIDALLGGYRVAVAEIATDPSKLGEGRRLLHVSFPPGPRLPQAGLALYQPRQQMKLPRGPVLVGIRHQRVPCHHSQSRGNGPLMQGVMMDDRQVRFVPDRPAALAGTPAQIDILVVQKEAFIEAAKIAQTILAHQQTATGHPRNLTTLLRAERVILSPAAWQNKPGDGAQQRRQRTRRQLLGAIAVAQVKTDDSRVRFELIQERQDAVE